MSPIALRAPWYPHWRNCGPAAFSMVTSTSRICWRTRTRRQSPSSIPASPRSFARRVTPRIPGFMPPAISGICSSRKQRTCAGSSGGAVYANAVWSSSDAILCRKLNSITGLSAKMSFVTQVRNLGHAHFIMLQGSWSPRGLWRMLLKTIAARRIDRLVAHVSHTLQLSAANHEDHAAERLGAAAEEG